VIYDGEIYCTGCLPDGVDVDGVDGDGDDICNPIFAGSEWDTYPVCCHCGECHNYVTLLEYDKKWFYHHYAAVIYDGEIYCTGCLPDGVDVDGVDGDGDDICTPIFACSAVDYCPICCHCGKVHDCTTLLKYSGRGV
jgi:hypothetical protein